MKCEWQPIETAPKDGTRIIVGASGFPSTTAFYCQPGSCVWWTGWAEGGNRSDMYGTEFEPTHWMPLPEPPQ